MLVQDRIGRRDHVLVAAVEGQRGKARARRRRQRAVARLVQCNDVVFPALQRADGAVEKARRDFLRLVRLEARHAAGAHALEPQHDAGATALALLHARIEAEISELHLRPPYEPVIRRHVRPQNMPSGGPIVITLC